MTSETRPHPYDASEIEPRWQARWEELGMHTTDLYATDKPKFYLLTMYPYPSGDLHTGHWSIVAPTDVAGRFKRMQGYNVFFPLFDLLLGTAKSTVPNAPALRLRPRRNIWRVLQEEALLYTWIIGMAVFIRLFCETSPKP